MSARSSFFIYVESREPALLANVVRALGFDPESESLTLTVPSGLLGVWLTLFDGNGQMNFWGALEANVPGGMARWWEIADSDSADTRFVNAWSADGEARWEEPELDLGLTRLRKELGLREKADFLPDEEGWLAEAKVVALTEDYERELAAAFGGRRKGSAPRPRVDPHAPWREREDRTIVRKAQSLVDAAPEALTALRDRLDFAEVLWRTGKTKRAREVLAALRPSRDDVRRLLELGAPSDLLQANVRYLPDFALELIECVPRKTRGGTYWLRRAQALAKLDDPGFPAALRALLEQKDPLDETALRDAVLGMPKKSPRRREAMEILAAFEPAERPLGRDEF